MNKEMFIYEIAKKSDVSYSHVHKIITMLENKDIITKKAIRGRRAYIKLTIKGEKLRTLYNEIVELIK